MSTEFVSRVTGRLIVDDWHRTATRYHAVSRDKCIEGALLTRSKLSGAGITAGAGTTGVDVGAEIIVGFSIGSEHLTLSGFEAVSRELPRLVKTVVATELGVSGCVIEGAIFAFLFLEKRLKSEVFGFGGGVMRVACRRARSCRFCSAMVRWTAASMRAASCAGSSSVTSFFPNMSFLDLLFVPCRGGGAISSLGSLQSLSCVSSIVPWAWAACSGRFDSSRFLKVGGGGILTGLGVRAYEGKGGTSGAFLVDFPPLRL